MGVTPGALGVTFCVDKLGDDRPMAQGDLSKGLKRWAEARKKAEREGLNIKAKKDLEAEMTEGMRLLQAGLQGAPEDDSEEDAKGRELWREYENDLDTLAKEALGKPKPKPIRPINGN